ncbi:ferredoxin [Rhodococcus maanshanensis]|uniref:Ferredoxin n=1 Tax=Rhodococcus maanshanensis TaxID=183556 RepID=A0A1H7WCD9_9NOCA|nr:ferredoxin [Rhodococcus maanshanensis]SEM19160.1 ferredoxin [Rhodococcus maanshanensis]
MEVKVDRDRCEANGVCVGIAPDIFDLTDDDELVITQPGDDADAVAKMEESVAQCPRAALTLER